MEFMLGAVVGFFVGVIASCFLLAKKNLEAKEIIEQSVSTSVKDGVAQYKAMMKAYDEEEARKEAEANQTDK